MANRSALIIASDEYTDPGLSQLRAPEHDAAALSAVLSDEEIGDFDVQTMLNQQAHDVSLAVETFFADRHPDDLLLMHVSCHGVKDESGELYFATSNTQLRRLGATAIAAGFVNRCMSRSRSRRVVLLLDCCYAGAFEYGMAARAGSGVAIEEQLGGRGRAVITASSAMEYAFEGNELTDSQVQSPSVFTSALVDGLKTGDADRDQDGLVALDELYDYVYERVRVATPNQTPGKWVFGVQGDLLIARRARPVSTPAPLPPELVDAIGSPFASVRAAVIDELSRLRQGRHAGLALAAEQQLQALTADDSRSVSLAAQRALDNAAPTPMSPPLAADPETPSPPALAPEEPSQPVPAATAQPPIQSDPPAAAAPMTPQVEPVTQVDPETSAVDSEATEPASSEAGTGDNVSAAVATNSVETATSTGSAAATVSRDRALVVAGVLAIVAAVLTTVALPKPAVVDNDQSIWELTLNNDHAYYLITVAFQLVVGACLLHPRLRPTLGVGLAVALGAISLSSPVTLIRLDNNLRIGGTETASGFDLLLLGSLVTVAAGVVTLVAGLRSGGMRFSVHQLKDPTTWPLPVAAAVGVGVMMANRESSPYPFDDIGNAPIVIDAILLLAVALGAGCAIPRRLGAAMWLGFTIALVSALAYWTEIGAWIILVAVGCGLVSIPFGRRLTAGQPQA